ncbi:hypothetical protein HNP82_003541 [Catenibacillus scindens]|uniref:Tyr recombinase domain-containing protein n=1 Tax=Catenibacillus scindens TaxID=673271 RepID=A0A7W8HDB7_9FIRM|nr:tyrosine-type recombinase/integrase [Catenibacillus scindens]MBB5266384.1 hypothetical protein [Catenibacillus scindens]
MRGNSIDKNIPAKEMVLQIARSFQEDPETITELIAFSARFPVYSLNNTRLIRKVFLPQTVARLLGEWRNKQDEEKEILGDEYFDYGLVIAGTFGLPLGFSAIQTSLKKLIQDYDLPPVVFHSLRHTSVTYKLKLNGGDIKAVQGDSGHSQINMVTDVYSHILDDDRRKNTELFENAFYKNHNPDPQIHETASENLLHVPEGIDKELLSQVLSSPELSALLMALAKTIKI